MTSLTLVVKAKDKMGLEVEEELEIPYSTVRGMASSELATLVSNKISIIRVFFPNLAASWVNDQKCKMAWANGGFPIISFGSVDWKRADIDLLLDRLLELKASGNMAVLCFNHEPEHLSTSGSAMDFKLRWVDYVSNQKALVPDAKVKWCWIMQGWTFDPRSKRDAMQWYPGDDFVDFIGADIYDWAQYHKIPHLPLSSIGAPALAFANNRKKRLMITEYGIAPFDGSNMDRVYVEQAAYKWANDNGVPVMCYFNRTDPNNDMIDWTLTTAEAGNIYFRPKTGE